MDPGIQPVSISDLGLEWKAFQEACRAPRAGKFRLHAPRQPGPGQVEVNVFLKKKKLEVTPSIQKKHKGPKLELRFFNGGSNVLHCQTISFTFLVLWFLFFHYLFILFIESTL